MVHFHVVVLAVVIMLLTLCVCASASDVINKTKASNIDVDHPRTGLTTAQSAILSALVLEDDAGLKKLYHDAVYNVSRIVPMLKKAKDLVSSIETKNEEIKATVEEIKKLLINTTDKTKKELVNNSLIHAQGNIRTALNNVYNAKQSISDMVVLTTLANETLNTITVPVTEGSAGKNFTHMSVYFSRTEEELTKIEQTLKSTEAAAANATSRKNEAEKALLPQKGESSDENGAQTADENRGRTNDNKPAPSVHSATNPSPNGDAVKRELLRSEGKQSGALNDSMHKAPQQPINEGKKTDKFNEQKVHTLKQNMTNVSVIAEKVPTSGNKFDSALTVSVPLLVALIASAVLL